MYIYIEGQIISFESAPFKLTRESVEVCEYFSICIHAYIICIHSYIYTNIYMYIYVYIGPKN